MKAYRADTPSLEMNIAHALDLFDDGRFTYSCSVWDFAGQGSQSLEGTWRREGDVIFFLPTVHSHLYKWDYGQERKAVDRGDTLEIDDGPTLQYMPDLHYVWPDRVESSVVRNDSEHPYTVLLEPSGERRTLAPGERVRVVFRFPADLGYYDLERTEHYISYHVREGAEVSFVDMAAEPSRTEPPSSQPTPRVAVPEPAEEASAEPAARPCVVGEASPDLAARLQQRVDEFSKRTPPAAERE